VNHDQGDMLTMLLLVWITFLVTGMQSCMTTSYSLA
jgi:hypothetical protein